MAVTKKKAAIIQVQHDLGTLTWTANAKFDIVINTNKIHKMPHDIIRFVYY